MVSLYSDKIILGNHYQKFAKYQRIYRRNISVGNLRSKLPTETFPSVIQSVTTDGLFSVCNSVGNYRRKFSIGSYRLNYGRKSFRIKNKRRVADVEVLAGYFFRRNHRWIQNDSPYSDVTGAPFTLPTDPPRDLKWQIRTVTCQFFHQKIPSVKPSEKVNICQLCQPSPPLFLLLFPNPNSPHLQTTSPPSPSNKNLPHISTTSYIS